ncbi:MAG: hypothetical protein JOZ16_06760 [Methylobacteriaceae bacterium]|nr:hypothetical protein [Methylobacteriaceae bacterium]
MGEGSLASPARLLSCAGLCLALCFLGGCNETTGSLREPIKAAANAPARNPNASPRGASVALTLTGVETVPRGVVSRFSEALAHAVAVREVDVADPKLAKYFVQMHLTAYPAGDGGTALAYVCDVFDAKKNRAQRLSDDIALKGTSGDPWSLVDDKAVETIAARSADDLAAFLSNTPEAVAAANAAPTIIARPSEAPDRVRVPAPVTTSPGMPSDALSFAPAR